MDTIQVFVVEAMMQCNEVDLAAEYQKAFGLQRESVSVDDASLAARREQRRQNYYPLQLPDESVTLVSTEEQVIAAQAVLCCQSSIGFDMEWKPGTGATHASTLQVHKDNACLFVRIIITVCFQLAGESVCYIFDLLALRNSEALHDVVQEVFCDRSIMKLGFCPSQDLRGIEVICRVQRPANVYDLQQMWSIYSQKKKQPLSTGAAAGRGKRRAPPSKAFQSVGLSEVVLALLGKPLDKLMQTSNWNRRPLTEGQICYAAQDAHVLLTLYDHMAADVDTSLSSLC